MVDIGESGDMSVLPIPAEPLSLPLSINDEAALFDRRTLPIYPVSNYQFGVKDAQPSEDPSPTSRLKSLYDEYKEHGLRRTVEAVFLVHQHNHPHVLLLQVANGYFKLPGDSLLSGEDELEGLSLRLSDKLAPLAASTDDEPIMWHIGDCLAVWYRPNFENNFYPYLPPHITKPKEEKKLYLVYLPADFLFAVPKNLSLVAVPLFELLDNSSRYGPLIASIPHLLSRYNILYC